MEISPVGGAGQSAPRVQPAMQHPSGPAGAAGQLALQGNGGPQGSTAAAPAESPKVSQSSHSASTNQSTFLLGESGRPSTSMALAMYILSMLLQNSSEKEEDKFMMGLAAGLLSAEQGRDQRLLFSSSNSMTSTTSTTTIGSEQVNAAYNTEMPNVAANAAGAAGPATDGATMPVQGINTSA